MIGHALGAAGAIESVACIQMLRGRLRSPLAELRGRSPPDRAVRGVDSPRDARPMPRLATIVKASFGFGDVNACVVFRKWTGEPSSTPGPGGPQMTEDQIFEKVVEILKPYAKNAERARRACRSTPTSSAA